MFADLDTVDSLKMIRESARDFAQKHILPHVMEWDEAQIFPRDLFSKMGELGFMGILVPHEYGGSGLGYQEYITVIEEIGKACGSIGLSVAAHNSLCTNHILEFGNEEQKQNRIRKVTSSPRHLKTKLVCLTCFLMLALLATHPTTKRTARW